jgi:hypothetical protein
MGHEKSETIQNPIDKMFYNLDTIDDRHKRINPYDYFPEVELESPNVGVERGLGVLGGPYKTGEEGAEAARKRSMNFRLAMKELKKHIENPEQERYTVRRIHPKLKPEVKEALLALKELLMSGYKSFAEGYKPGMRLR